MKYLLIKKNKLPQIHETNNIPNVITKMFGRKFRILNENDIAYCRSQSVYATKLDLVRDCMWIGRYEQYGSNLFFFINKYFILIILSISA